MFMVLDWKIELRQVMLLGCFILSSASASQGRVQYHCRNQAMICSQGQDQRNNELVHGPGVDMDHCVLGHLILLEDFFYMLHIILADMEKVTELQPVTDAHVPVLKFKFDGISIDLVYASISLLVVPEGKCAPQIKPGNLGKSFCAETCLFWHIS